jgi:glycerol-3-phosphate acyltransferase PlsY
MVLARVMNLGNLRDIGSGNIGATNVLRTGSKKAAALTLLLDGGKGAVAVLLGRFALGEDAAQLMGLAAMLGHCFPVWLGFKGGKGVATFLGILLALAWPVGLAACGIWLLTAALSRMSSLSAIVSSVASTFLLVAKGYGTAFFLGVILTILLIVRHRDNIKRINAGLEPKIGQKK